MYACPATGRISHRNMQSKMPEEESYDLTDFLTRQASEAVFLFNQVYSGLQGRLNSVDHKVTVSTEITVAIIRNIAIIGNQTNDDE